MKIVYAGIRHENYAPMGRESFEYTNFFLTLEAMSGVEVVEYPFDPILKVGKKRFNEDLLELVRRGKPDIFFAFMFTDELELATLDELKKVTKTVAWFADDHWRLFNYSRQYAPHFTWCVTTWSKAPEIYARYGSTNIIRSEWAANPNVFKPITVNRDRDVSFVGQWSAPRGRLIRALREAGVNVWVRGRGWEEGEASYDEAIENFSRSKISLNLASPLRPWALKSFGRLLVRRARDRFVSDFHLIDNFRSWWGMQRLQIKARPFEILACRAFLISDRADDIDHYYEEGKEIVYYNGTPADLIEKVRYYLSHADERERIAEAGYERTMREHTYEKRFREIFRIVLSV